MSSKGGPKPTPTALKVVQGARPSRVNTKEPKPAVRQAPPTAPTHLSVEAQGVWKALAADMHRKGVLTTWDLDTFAVYCEAVVVHRQASADITDRGVLVKGERGSVKNPALQVQREAAATLIRAAVELGLTPSARSSLKMTEEETDEALRLLS